MPIRTFSRMSVGAVSSDGGTDRQAATVTVTAAAAAAAAVEGLDTAQYSPIWCSLQGAVLLVHLYCQHDAPLQAECCHTVCASMMNDANILHVVCLYSVGTMHRRIDTVQRSKPNWHSSSRQTDRQTAQQPLTVVQQHCSRTWMLMALLLPQTRPPPGT